MSQSISVARGQKGVNVTLLIVVLTAASTLAVAGIQMLSPLLLDMAAEFHTSIAVIGQLATVGAMIWAVMGPVCGALSDRVGRKPQMIAGLVTFGFFTIVSSWADNLPFLFAARILACSGGAFLTTNLLASVADFFPPERRARVLGWTISGFSLGAMLCVPAVALVAQASDWRWSVRLVGASLLIMAIVIHIVVPYLPPQRAKNVGAAFSSVMRNRSVLALLSSNICERVFYSALATYMAAFLMQTYGLSTGGVAPVISAIAVATLIGTLAGGRIAERANPMIVFALAQLAAGLLSPALVLFPVAVWFSVLVAGAFTGANALGRPAFLFMVTQGSPSIRGAMLGLTVTANQIGLMLGGALGGLGIALGGYNGFAVLCGLTGIMSAAICRLLVRSDDLRDAGAETKPRAGGL